MKATTYCHNYGLTVENPKVEKLIRESRSGKMLGASELSVVGVVIDELTGSKLIGGGAVLKCVLYVTVASPVKGKG